MTRSYVKKANIPAPVPEYLYDASGHRYKTEDLLKNKTKTTLINLKSKLHKQRISPEKEIEYRSQKFTVQEILLLSNGTLAECKAHWPNKSDRQLYSMRYYARVRKSEADAIIAQNKP